MLNKPYDIFGTWYNDSYLLSGNLHWLGHLTSCSVLWLNKVIKPCKISVIEMYIVFEFRIFICLDIYIYKKKNCISYKIYMYSYYFYKPCFKRCNHVLCKGLLCSLLEIHIHKIWIEMHRLYRRGLMVQAKPGIP